MCTRAFHWYQNQWPWVTHDPGFKDTVGKICDFRPLTRHFSETVQDMTKVVIDHYRNVYTRFRLVPKSITLDDLERINGRFRITVCSEMAIFSLLAQKYVAIWNDKSYLLPFFIPSTSLCSLSSWFTSSCAYHLITVTTFFLTICHSLCFSLQTQNPQIVSLPIIETYYVLKCSLYKSERKFSAWSHASVNLFEKRSRLDVRKYALNSTFACW